MENKNLFKKHFEAQVKLDFATFETTHSRLLVAILSAIQEGKDIAVLQSSPTFSDKEIEKVLPQKRKTVASTVVPKVDSAPGSFEGVVENTMKDPIIKIAEPFGGTVRSSDPEVKVIREELFKKPSPFPPIVLKEGFVYTYDSPAEGRKIGIIRKTVKDQSKWIMTDNIPMNTIYLREPTEQELQTFNLSNKALYKFEN